MGGINIKRKNKVLMALTVFLILFVLIGSVNAAKDNTTISQDNNKEINQEKTGIDESSLNKEILKTNNENTTLKTPVSGDTFADIQDAIDSATEGDTIELNGLYKGTGTQITITQNNLTIIGTNNATLDAQGLSEIMTISGNDVTLKNINFINGKSTSDGGAIHWTGDNGIVTYCTFTNNTANNGNGGAIYWRGDNGQVTNCTFTNNTANQYSGAIRWTGDNGTVTNCTFTNNNGGAIYWYQYAGNGQVTNCTFTNNNGGAIYWNAENGQVTNCTFTNNNGGAIYWNAENGQVTNSTFTNNTAKYNGGAIIWFGTNGIVTNCTFTNNTAKSEDGGAIIWDGNNGIVTNCTFTNNTANLNGGAIYWLNGSNGTVTYCTFTNNTANDRCGAIYWSNGFNGTVTYCTFTNNAATSSNFGGGAIYWNKENGIVTNCTFTNNTAKYGGAIYWTAANGTVTNCTFTNNTASDGGAIFWTVGANGTVTGCTFTNNTAKYSGGAIHWNAANGIVTNCTFTNNTASDGGAIYWDYVTNGQVTYCTFTHNTANNNGGVIYWEEYDGTVTYCNFTNNTANNDGGAIYWNKENGKVTYCTFTNNTANSDGGAIYWDYYAGYGQVTNCTFTNNTANYGGAINWNKENGTVTYCTFTHNTANQYGGAIHWSHNAGYGQVTNCTFTQNTANTFGGGAIHWSEANGTITNCTFTNNTATSSYYGGGAIILWGRNGTIINCIFTNNTATSSTFGGGAIYSMGANGQVTNCTFTNNTATSSTFGGGAIFWHGTNGTVTYCTFTHNTANQYGGAIDWQGTSGTVNYCNFTGNKANNLRNIYCRSSDLYLSNSTLETFATINKIEDCVVGSNITINYTFDDGTNLNNYNVTLYNNNELIIISQYSSGHRYVYKWNGLAVGIYSITINDTNTFGNKYVTSNPMKFEVFKGSSSVIINDIVNGTYQTVNATIKFNIVNKTNVTIIVTKNGSSVKLVNLTNFEENIFNIITLAAGIYNITIINNENENYTQSNASALFNVAKATSEVEITGIINGTYKTTNAIVNFNILNSTSVRITVRDARTGSVVYGNTSFIGNVFTIGNLTIGVYNITIINNGNENYTTSSASALFNIAKTKLNPDDIIINVTPGQGNATVNITGLPEDFTGDVSVIINGTNYPIHIENGTGIEVIPLTPGNHTITGVNITNNPIYEDTFIPKDETFDIDKKTINPDDIIINVTPGKGNATVNITGLPKDFNGNITVTIDNTTYQIPVINGTGSRIIPLTPGNHTLTGVNITNNTMYDDISIPENISFVVENVTPQHTYYIIDNKDMKVFYREGARYTVRIVDETGKPVNGKSVTFKVNDITYTAVSDANGYASILIDWKPGKSTITATCEESSVSNSIQVKSVIHATKNVKVKKSKKATKFKVTLWGLRAKIVKKPAFKYNGKTKVPIKIGTDLAGKKVSVKFKGEYFTTKVNSKGKGVLKISKKLARELKLKKGKKYKAHVVYKDMVIYKNTPVNVKIDGKTYTVKTNKNGAVIFKITKKMVKNLKPGKTYPYYVEFGENIAKKNLVIKK